MPLGGIRCMVDAMFISACMPNSASNPPPASMHEQVGVLERPDEAAQHDEAEEDDQQQTDEKPELLAGDGEDEVGVRIGQRLLDMSLARSAAEQPAAVKGFERPLDLIALAASRIEELIDATSHVAEHGVGADAARDEQQADQRDQHQRAAGEEDLQAPGAANQHGRADVRLQDQNSGDRCPAAAVASG